MTENAIFLITILVAVVLVVFLICLNNYMCFRLDRNRPKLLTILCTNRQFDHWVEKIKDDPSVGDRMYHDIS
ncbi:hypothetical protein ACK8P5_26600 (plasmid) [Paenibacillus sp. EC2-1]|uniref:hypothetical protein n=1 Tax=Paenibacillus sp. EC2-1 TaxID=3388665 RepID=UPI003BEEE3C2